MDDHQLFDDRLRTDSAPASYSESSFAFLNRVASPFWERVRDELNRWFSGYPADDRADLRARFRSSAPAQHWAAWWELYLFSCLSHLDLEVVVHPETDAGAGRPDFLVRQGSGGFYVEAATVFSGIVEDGRNGTPGGLDP